MRTKILQKVYFLTILGIYCARKSVITLYLLKYDKKSNEFGGHVCLITAKGNALTNMIK